MKGMQGIKAKPKVFFCEKQNFEFYSLGFIPFIPFIPVNKGFPDFMRRQKFSGQRWLYKDFRRIIQHI